jgi:hypothetical protein
MNKELKKQLGDKKRLIEILGVSAVQAWRLWEGKNRLTPANEKLIRMVLESESK